VLTDSGYPTGRTDKNQVNDGMTPWVPFVMLIYVTMVYGPIAAFLAELFLMPVRYTSMSLPYDIGNNWFGGMLSLLATAMAAVTGDIYCGLRDPITVSVMALAIGAIFLRETKERGVHQGRAEIRATPGAAGPVRLGAWLATSFLRH
jgi:hypothetical protein